MSLFDYDENIILISLKAIPDNKKRSLYLKSSCHLYSFIKLYITVSAKMLG
jgi:hypothetical protein